MIITLPLAPQDEAKLIAIAQAKGLSADALIGEVLAKILDDSSEVNHAKEPTRSARGILAKYGQAPSAEEIDQNRAEMFSALPSNTDLALTNDANEPKNMVELFAPLRGLNIDFQV